MDVKNTQPGVTPLIANHGVRRRLLAAKTAPPGELNLENVATVVEHSIGKRSEQQFDIFVRTWFCWVCLRYLYLVRRAYIDYRTRSTCSISSVSGP